MTNTNAMTMTDTNKKTKTLMTKTRPSDLTKVSPTATAQQETDDIQKLSWINVLSSTQCLSNLT